MSTEHEDQLLYQFARVFVGCFVLAVAFLFLWFFAYVTLGDWMYALNTRWFAVSRREFMLLNYGGLAFAKISAILFFLLPYLSIKFALRKK